MGLPQVKMNHEGRQRSGSRIQYAFEVVSLAFAAADVDVTVDIGRRELVFLRCAVLYSAGTS